MFLHPTRIVKKASDVSYEWLQEQGIRAVLMDLDNTLMRPKAGILPPEIAAWLNGLKASGFLLAVITNNHHQHYLASVEAELGMPVIGDAKKPNGDGLLKALELFQVSIEEAVMVGDRPLTDILSAQRLGMKSILVFPLVEEGNTLMEQAISWLRWLERLTVYPF